LLGLCLGLRGETLGLKKLNVDPFSLLEKKNLQF
jgi:hypothetical protein